MRSLSLILGLVAVAGCGRTDSADGRQAPPAETAAPKLLPDEPIAGSVVWQNDPAIRALEQPFPHPPGTAEAEAGVARVKTVGVIPLYATATPAPGYKLISASYKFYRKGGGIAIPEAPLDIGDGGVVGKRVPATATAPARVAPAVVPREPDEYVVYVDVLFRDAAGNDVAWGSPRKDIVVTAPK